MRGTKPARGLFFFRVSYNGLPFCGWQRQRRGKSIVGTLEEKWRLVLRSPDIKILGATRTDRGVHALSQSAVTLVSPLIVAKLISRQRGYSPQKIINSLNGLLKPSIKILNLAIPPPEFQVRFNAIRKSYLYFLYLDKSFSLFNPWVWPVGKDYSLEKLQAVLKVLSGEHDFRCFAKKHSVKDKNCTRHIYPIKILQKGKQVIIFFQGNGFLHNQVRSMVGTCIELTRNQKFSKFGCVAQIKEILQSKERIRAGITAPANALFLHKVYYPGNLLKSFKYLI